MAISGEQLLHSYLEQLHSSRATGYATEHTHRPALKTLLDGLGDRVDAVNEPKRSKCGAPDFSVIRPTRHGPVTLGYVEAKDIGVSLDAMLETDQLQRYLAGLENLVLTDYLEFRWFVAGEHRLTARAGIADGTGVHIAVDSGNAAVALLNGFLARAPSRITRPRELAERMARLAHLVRDVMVNAFAEDAETETTRGLREAFTQVLIPDLSVEAFADMFSQTVAYGLFAARANHKSTDPFTRQDAIFEIPRTNPFLRRLFGVISGPDLEDEPFVGLVDDLAQLLAMTDIDAVLAEFGTTSRRRDPIVHFYETFLAAYDPVLREQRGVYYTPEPVVGYIVRSVDAVISSDFSCQEGLGERSRTNYTSRVGDNDVVMDAPRVLILDPACGTGTFLYSIVDLIRERFRSTGNVGKWSSFVREQLLPRLIGFELLMAPYAVAHLKLAMQLAAQDLSDDERDDWAYDFGSDERLNVYLTNSLEEAVRKSEVLLGAFISEEANAAAKIKRELPIMVVLGNPPYSGHSANSSYRIVSRKRGRKRVQVREKTFIGTLLDAYYRVDGQPLGERTSKWLQDDYVKFIRFGQWKIDRTGQGVLAYVSNHSFLDNPTFRGMRQQLMESFTSIYLLDLHGNQRKRERAPAGETDENVFDILQGVAIGVFIKDPDSKGPTRVYHTDLWGTRDKKYKWLSGHHLGTTQWSEIEPRSPTYLFKPQNRDMLSEFEQGWKLSDIFPHHGSGMTTARDHVVVDFEREQLIERAKIFRDEGSVADACQRLSIPEKRGWDARQARELLRQEQMDLSELVVPVLYRPFDERLIFYHDSLVWRTSKQVMGHMLVGDNVALAVGRAGQVIGQEEWDIAFCSVSPTDFNLFRRGGNYLYPLYLYDGGADGISSQISLSRERVPNVSQKFVTALELAQQLRWTTSGTGDLTTTVGPEDVTAYVYGLLYSRQYRWRYAEFLQGELPRIPLTTDRELFTTVVAAGSKLIALHTGGRYIDPGINFPVPGQNIIAGGHPKFVAPGEPDPDNEGVLDVGRIYISPNRPRADQRGQYFNGVAPDVWEFTIGGYRVCEKWLKDRRGLCLKDADLTQYEQIVGAISATLQIMDEIDDAIPSWPLP